MSHTFFYDTFSSCFTPIDCNGVSRHDFMWIHNEHTTLCWQVYFWVWVFFFLGNENIIYIFPSCRVKELNGNSKSGGAAKAQEPMISSSDEVSLHKMSPKLWLLCEQCAKMNAVFCLFVGIGCGYQCLWRHIPGGRSGGEGLCTAPGSYHWSATDHYLKNDLTNVHLHLNFHHCCFLEGKWTFQGNGTNLIQHWGRTSWPGGTFTEVIGFVQLMLHDFWFNSVVGVLHGEKKFLATTNCIPAWHAQHGSVRLVKDIYKWWISKPLNCQVALTRH